MCPGNAIYEETKVFNDGSHEHIDYKKCTRPFSESMGCSICIKECVFLKSGYNKIEENYK